MAALQFYSRKVMEKAGGGGEVMAAEETFFLMCSLLFLSDVNGGKYFFIGDED